MSERHWAADLMAEPRREFRILGFQSEDARDWPDFLDIAFEKPRRGFDLDVDAIMAAAGFTSPYGYCLCVKVTDEELAHYGDKTEECDGGFWDHWINTEYEFGVDPEAYAVTPKLRLVK